MNKITQFSPKASFVRSEYMKKYYWILVLIIGLIGLSYLSCNRTSSQSLRIVSINNSAPLSVDIADWGLEVDPENPEDTIHTYHIAPDQIVPVEVTYTETGIGLPTYPTGYTARITDYKVTFSRIKITPNDPSWTLTSFSGATNIVVPSDPEGGSTVTANLKIIPTEWISFWFDSLNQGVAIRANVILSGYEELTRNPISDTASFTVDFADLYDDPFNFNQ